MRTGAPRSSSRVRCDADTVAPAKATLSHAAKAPRGEIRRYPAGHFDIYIGEHFERVISDATGIRHLTSLERLHSPP